MEKMDGAGLQDFNEGSLHGNSKNCLITNFFTFLNECL